MRVHDPERPGTGSGDTRAGSLNNLSPPAPGEMKTIGIIGGVGWSSSLEYYRIMNEKTQNDLGGDNSAKILMYSIEFGEFSKQERLADAGN